MRRTASTIAITILAIALYPNKTLQAETAPTTQPQSQSNPNQPQIQRWFDQLADTDPDTRDNARTALMGLDRDQLNTLRQVVQKSRPIAPSQISVLREIVTQAFLATEPYERDNAAGFLGVHPVEVHQGAVGGEDPDSSTQRIDGVQVLMFVPGFCGNHYLRENDIVLGIAGKDYVSTQRADVFTELVRATPPGESLTLQILRQGKVMRVTVKLDARPLAAKDPAAMNEFINPRTDAAEQYWQKNFAALVAGPYS